MKWLLLMLLLLTVFDAQNANALGWQWAKGAGGGSGVSGSTTGRSVSTDAIGNVYVTGNCSTSTTTFGSIILSAEFLYLFMKTKNCNYFLCDLSILFLHATIYVNIDYGFPIS